MAKRKGIMLAYPFEERRLAEPKFNWRYPVMVQPKLDGERCRIVCRGTEPPLLLSSSEAPIVSVPHISRYIQTLNLYTELDGELYTHGFDQSDVHSIVSRQSEDTIHPDHSAVQFWCFDKVSKQSQLARIAKIQALPESEEFRLVPSFPCYSFEEILVHYDLILRQGYEGIIIRHIDVPYMRKRSRFMMKFKPKKVDHYQITNTIEAVSKDGKPKGILGAFVCMGDDGVQFKVGAGRLNHETRKDYWDMRRTLVGKTCVVQYQNLTPNQVPRFGLCVEVI